jgi:hypothetical protein
LYAAVSDDPGYFGERLGAAADHSTMKGRGALRSTLVQESTEVFGASLLASKIFSEGPSGDRRVLVLFPDMRNSTSVLNLERFQVLAQARVRALPYGIIQPNLHNVEEYSLGVDPANRSAMCWQELRQF